MSTVVSEHPWSEEAFFNKAKLYVEEMESKPGGWQSAFWSALSLELLARAALAHISPVLLANQKDWHNLMHALGKNSTKKGFSATSIPANELFSRVRELVREFSNEDYNFCMKHAERRNTEIHSSELAFESLNSSAWLPRFYQVCKALAEFMGRQLADLISDPETAQKMIDSLKDATAKSVRQDIDAHRTVWSNRSEKDRRKAVSDAESRATPDEGHRATCPACGSMALVQGTEFGPVDTRLGEDEIIEKQEMYPSSFECFACGLRISGLSRLSVCGLGNTFSKTVRYTVDEYYSDFWADYASAYYEVDMNE